MTACPGCGWPHQQPYRLSDQIDRIDSGQENVTDLDDHVVLVLDRWSDGRNSILRAEVARRHAYYSGLARQFANSINGQDHW